MRKPHPMLDNWINYREIIMLTGRHKTYKSFWAGQLVASLLWKSEFMGERTHWDERPIFVVQQEISSYHYRERFMRQMGGAMPEPGDLWISSESGLRLSEADPEFQEVDAQVDELNPCLIVLDNLSKMYPRGFEPNNENDAAEIMRLLRKWRNHGATILLLHHDAKGEPGVASTARGSGIWEDDPDGIIRLVRRGKMVNVYPTLRHGEEPPPVTLYMNPDSLLLEVREDGGAYEKGTSRRTAEEEGVSASAIRVRRLREKRRNEAEASASKEGESTDV